VIPAPIADAGKGAIVILAAWRLFDLNAHGVLARLRTISCDECTQPIRWWHRRVWIAPHERCVHLQCWNGQQFLKTYVQLMSEELRHSPGSPAHTDDLDSSDTELRELRASARTLRQRVERLEAQLQQAEELAAKTRINAVRKHGKLSAPAHGMPAKKG
jgi:ribosomal protein S19